MKKNKNKIIPLDQFIDKALYDKKCGYYMKSNPFGKNGDFVTAPSISILFSEMILVWIISFWENLNKPNKFNIIELGSGNADMMFQIIKTSKKFSNFYKSCNFYIYEKSPFLKKIQQSKLQEFNVKWINNLNNLKKAPSLFLGNEFLDAFPIKQLIKKKNSWFERHVDTSLKKKIIDKKINKNNYKKILNFSFFKNQKFIEFSPSLMKFLKTVFNQIKLKNGGFLIIDYGYYNNKMFDTLQSIKNHKKNNWLKNISKADLTYLVNFKLIEALTKKYNLKVNKLTSQREFLINLGILNRAEIISKNLIFSKKADIYYRLNRLINKSEMGELFKVMFVLNKKIKFNTGFVDD